MRYLSACSGIEAASVAWAPLGWQPAAFAEIDAFPSAVLKHHYPNVPNLGDITRFREWPDATIDVLVGGTPCQSFSVAGLRAGLADPRGNLCLTFLGIAERYRPRWLLWENVPGVLSSDGGRDFGAFLGGLGQLGYGWAYRVLDAQYVRTHGFPRAVPQRRRRVFVVGYLGSWGRAAAVLFERESLQGHPAPRRKARQGIAPTISSRPTGGSRYRNDADTADNLIAGTLDASFGRLQGASGQDLNHGHSHLVAFDGNDTTGPIEVATACRAKGSSGHGDFESETFVAHALRADGFDASEDGTGRSTPIVPIAVDWKNSAGGPNSEETFGTLCSERIPAIAFDARQSDACVYGDIAAPLDTDAFSQGIAVYPTLSAHEGGTLTQIPPIVQGWAVRRLTPRECERLQGFPDDYTDVPYRGKPAADGSRYKALGNSIAVNVICWIGTRIAIVDEL